MNTSSVLWRRVRTWAGAWCFMMFIAGCARTPEARRESPPPTVSVFKAVEMNVPILVSPNATTRALEEVTIVARVRGFLREIHFQEGAVVKTGDLLAVIEEDSYKADLDTAKAEVEQAEAELRRAKDSKAREVARAQVDLDDAQLALLRIELLRQRNLRARNANSQQDLDQAEANYKKQEAQIAADKASLQQAEADYDTNILAAQAKIDAAKARRTQAEITLGYCRVFAPINGRIGQRLVTKGNVVGPTTGTDFTKLATIEQLDPMGLDLYPATRYLERASKHIGLEVRLIRPGFDGRQDHPYPGNVYFFDNTVDPSTSTFLVKAKVPNPEQSILPGEYVKANLVIGEYPKAIVVPQEAVIESQIGQSVFVVGEDDTVSVARVKAIDTYEGMSVIQSGLKPGDRAIVEGVQLVRQGMKVKTKESSIAPPKIDTPAAAKSTR